MGKKILILTGDYSGKLYASKLVNYLLEKNSEIEIYTTFTLSTTTKRVHQVINLTDLGVVGIIETLPYLLYYYLQLQEIKRVIKERKIDIVIAIDFPDFNFRVIKFAKQNGVKVIYYLLPQLWAWRFERIEFLKKYTDMCLVAFKFEYELYTQYNLKCKFVGHPVIETIKNFKLQEERKAICFFPGSRTPTLRQLLPLYLHIAELIYTQFPNRPFIFGITQNIPDKLLKKYYFPYPFKYTRISNALELFGATGLAIIPTGTIALEAALLRIPAIIVNRTTYLNYALVKDKIKLPFLSLPNILAKEEIYPEFLQTKINTEKILQTAEDILDFPEQFEQKLQKLDAMLTKEFDYTEPIKMAGDEILSFLKS